MSESKVMTLMNGSKPLAVLRMDHVIVESVLEVRNKELFPICLKGKEENAKDIQNWLEKRLLPEKNREGYAETKKRFADLPRPYHMFSLSDQYWLRGHERNFWLSSNFFQNPYSTKFGDAMFEPWKVTKFNDDDEKSPDLTTNGVLMKRWLQDPDTMESYLYKVGSESYMQEPLSEVLASMMLAQAGFTNIVHYELAMCGMRLCSKSKNFVHIGEEFVPMSHLFNNDPPKEGESIYACIVRVCKNYGIQNAENFLDQMILADFIVSNYDRHLTNFGLLRDVETGKMKGFAPLFDFGTAYLGDENAIKGYVLGQEQIKAACAKYLTPELAELALPSKEMENLVAVYPGVRDELKKKLRKVMDSKKQIPAMAKKLQTEYNPRAEEFSR